MKALTLPSQFRKIRGPVFLGAGFFDGVHLGHRMVLEGTVRRARETGGQAWALTFDRHPLAVLAPSKSPRLLTTLDDRLRLFEELGMDGALILTFTRRMAVLEPETFVRRLCGAPRRDPGAAAPPAQLNEIRCGDNWRFGRRAAGTPALLAGLGPRYGFRVEIVPYAYHGGVRISSTRIRTAVCEGRLADAEAMLGRPFFISGRVVRGRGAGRPLLGSATANIRPPESGVLPPPGVYAVLAAVKKERFPAVADLGVRPTFGPAAAGGLLLETHLLDFEGDLYGREVTVSFLSRLRGERRFETPAALAAQIAADIARARSLFSRR